MLDPAAIDACQNALHWNWKLEGEPVEREELTDAQLSAFQERGCWESCPACEHGVLEPLGSRNERSLKFQSVVVNGSRKKSVPLTSSVSYTRQCLWSRTLDNCRAKFKEGANEDEGQRLHADMATRSFSLWDPAVPSDCTIPASTVNDAYLTLFSSHTSQNPPKHTLLTHKAVTPRLAENEGKSQAKIEGTHQESHPNILPSHSQHFQSHSQNFRSQGTTSQPQGKNTGHTPAIGGHMPKVTGHRPKVGGHTPKNEPNKR